MALVILKHTRHLNRVRRSSTFDFSAVQAISRWITDAVDGCPPRFLPFATHARALSDTVSLATGQGLFDMWNTLFAETTAQSPIADSVRLGKILNIIKDRPQAHGSSQPYSFCNPDLIQWPRRCTTQVDRIIGVAYSAQHI